MSPLRLREQEVAHPSTLKAALSRITHAIVRVRTPDELFPAAVHEQLHRRRHGAPWIRDAGDAFLQKPYTPHGLAQTVRDVLDQ